MFLTRIGYGSKAIVTGDITQIDLPGDKRSGLKEAAKILKILKIYLFVHLPKKTLYVIRLYNKL